MQKNSKHKSGRREVKINSLLFLLTPLSLLLGEIRPYDVSSDLSSDTASYDGKVLVLKGNVTLDHDLGKMESQVATLKKGGPSLEFATILLQNDVSIFFENQGKLFSDQAFLDFQTLTGTFSSNDYPIIYKGEKLDLFCSKIDLALSRSGPNFEISSLIAQEEVHIDYKKDFHVDCDKALYENDTLTAIGNDFCYCTHLDDTTTSKKITMDLKTNLLTLESPSGKLSSFFFPDDPDRSCQFASRLLLWDHQHDLLTLKGGVVIHDPLLGTLIGEDTFSLQQRKHFGKRTIQSIETKGKTVLSSNDSETLTSYGTLKIDRDELLLTCTSPSDKQLIYEKEDLLLFADSARIEYSFQGLELKPHTIYLDGNVQIFSHNLNRPLRKGIADHIIHNPTSKQTKLLADAGNHVLFWDDEKRLSLSAPEILINHEGEEEIVRGIGTVRFIFTEEEGKRIETLRSPK